MSNDKTSPEHETPQRPLALSIAVVAGVLAAVLRVVPHPPNFSGIGALGIFGGARLRGWQAYLLPLAIMVLSDLSLWLLTGLDPKYSVGHLSRVYVYASFMIYVAIGRVLADKNSLGWIAVTATAGALQFFLVTTFCDWLFQPYMEMPAIYRYSRDLNGLAMCYLAALGFAQNEGAGVFHPFMLFSDMRLALAWSVLGDVLFTTVYLLIYARLTKRASAAEPITVTATPA